MVIGPVDSPVSVIERTAAPLRQHVVTAIRDGVVSGRFEPGSRLIERSLCEELGVSRTVIREALRQLESEHLIEMIPNVGPIVHAPTPVEARSLYEVRAALESLAARDCAERAPADLLTRLSVALGHVRAAAEDNAIMALLDAKDEFIAVVVDGADNEVVGAMLTTVHARVSRLRGVTLRTPGRIPAMMAEMTAIHDAILARDSAAAARLSRQHVENAAAIALAG
ncbi:GntR family transcriptional regulator [Okibacterium endophyticum]